ncbi:hypothetical protein A9267_08835 [Shewanella sp. UCD-FRSSP16_17]|uniref:surface carbohydrate biosynthesis protein n=1 Tax=Shewanella sp. UCD-FRSSP16_17 TaxID=1853256 RepID=UPI0007EE9C2B|nr:surface carbohydrate biosynthesis protein [Shewanella sp. UCD-FRSSP16_17]OBT09107.1 hypothetical protein A9267_08835 [Shewanella sp. UCD-FRSSP16_17]
MSNFLFPIETTARELDHKILMAIKSLQQGRQIIIADQQYIRLLSFFIKGGVYFGKHLFGKPRFSDVNYFKRLKENYFNVVHLNEEGAVWPGGESVWKNLMIQSERPSVLSSSDFLATWGNWQRDFNLSYEEVEAKVITTGHSRFDLYRDKYASYFSDEVDKLRSDLGDFILINTSFSYSNNGEGGVKFIFKNTLSYDSNCYADREYRFGRWSNQMLSMTSIVYLVHKLSLEFPEKKIVIRPHPSESTEYYKDIFQNISNVIVTYDGPVTPWILACDLLIHNGCTTAIEASLANKYVINFQPSSSSSTSNVYLANICGDTVSEPDEVIQIIKSGTLPKKGIPNDELSNSLFENFKEKDSASRLLELLNAADLKVETKKASNFGSFTYKLITLGFSCYKIAKYAYYHFKGERNKHLDYKKRFEIFQSDIIRRKLARMAEIHNVKYKVKHLSNHCIVLEYDDKD